MKARAQSGGEAIPRNQTALLLKRVGFWKQSIATHLIAQKFDLSPAQAEQTARSFILALLYLYLAEQRHILPGQPLQALQQKDFVYARLAELWRSLIHPLDRNLINWMPPPLCLDDRLLQPIIHSLYQLDEQQSGKRSGEQSAILPIEALGQVYECFLDKVIQKKNTSKRPITKKIQGAYYTPAAIVRYMVQNTIDRLVCPPIPRILDPACGGGAFLLEAYQFLLNWQLQYHIQNRVKHHLPDNIYSNTAIDSILEWKAGWQLTLSERERILHCIYGVDIDSEAVTVTQLSLWLKLLEGTTSTRPLSASWSQNIRCGNAVIAADPVTRGNSGFDWQTAFPEVMAAGGFDAVIGNPPYIDSEWMTIHLSDWRRYCTAHYRTAVGNWDLFCVFIEKAIDLCRPGGLTSLIVPNKLASAAYAAKARSLLAQENKLLTIRDYSQVSVFPASVYPLVYLAQKQSACSQSLVQYEQIQYEQMKTIDRVGQLHTLQLTDPAIDPEAPWLVTNELQLRLITRLQQFPTLAMVAQVTGAATVSEAYALTPFIQNSPTVETGDLRLVNSGTIDRYRFLWGEKPLRYLGNTYSHPLIRQFDSQHLPVKRYEQVRQPKIIAAGMSRQLECAMDLTGSIWAGKSTVVIRLIPTSGSSAPANQGKASGMTDPGAIDLHYLLGLLNSRLISFYFAACFGGNSLQGGYLRVGAPQLRQLPICSPGLGNHSQQNGSQQTSYHQIVMLVEKMLILQQQVSCDMKDDIRVRQKLQQQISQIDDQLNQIIYRLYQLSDSEIETVLNWSF